MNVIFYLWKYKIKSINLIVVSKPERSYTYFLFCFINYLSVSQLLNLSKFKKKKINKSY